MRTISVASAAISALVLALVGAPLSVQAARSASPSDRHIAGTYSDPRLAGFKSLTLPRVFLYDRHGALVPQEHWPAELQGFREHAGDAFCCVSDTPPPPGSSGPPPDCKVIVYGTDVRGNFEGLLNSSSQAIRYHSLPKHKYLLVEYYATWCQPCVTGRKALETFFNSSSQAKDYLWVSIDMSRLPELQNAARASKH